MTSMTQNHGIGREELGGGHGTGAFHNMYWSLKGSRSREKQGMGGKLNKSPRGVHFEAAGQELGNGEECKRGRWRS